jgi:drug/metabolite transporter (DMT)-like permease
VSSLLPGSRALGVRGGTLLVILAATLWGTDALIRRPLAVGAQAATLVLSEHVVLVLAVAPTLPAALRALRRAGPRAWLDVLVVGAGASALATVLFTAAFQHADPITPVVLQKLQPLIAVLGAAILLGERPRRAYAPWFVLGLTGAWLLAFPQPTAISSPQATGAALAIGAAALWGLGTVLGRRLSADLAPAELTAARFAVGLPAAAVAVAVTGAPAAPTAHDVPGIIVLALVPGLLALRLYYRGLAATPASVATIAELAFPLTAALVGVLAFETRLATSQWVGAVVLAGSMTAMAAWRPGALVRLRPSSRGARLVRRVSSPPS